MQSALSTIILSSKILYKTAYYVIIRCELFAGYIYLIEKIHETCNTTMHMYHVHTPNKSNLWKFGNIMHSLFHTSTYVVG